MIQANIPILTIQNVRIVNSYRTHFFNNINDLMGVLLFNRIVQLNSWIVAETPYFLRVTEVSQLFSLSPTLTGVSGSGHRLRLATPSWPMSSAPTINQPQNRVAMHPTKNVIATLTTPQPKEKRYG